MTEETTQAEEQQCPEDIAIGKIVKYRGIRGQIRLTYKDAPYVAVITFPQDVGRIASQYHEDWPINQLSCYNHD